MPLSPVDIKVELLRAGVSMSAIGRQLDPPVTPTHVSKVIAGQRRSPRVERAIADVIERPADEVFPANAA